MLYAFKGTDQSKVGILGEKSKVSIDFINIRQTSLTPSP